MKILRLLSKKFILFFFYIFFFCNIATSAEPVDIWNIKKKNDDSKNNVTNTSTEEDEEISISDNIKNETTISITQETDLSLVKNYLAGLYDPDDNDLSINMWEFSDGEKILEIIKKTQNIKNLICFKKMNLNFLKYVPFQEKMHQS